MIGDDRTGRITLLRHQLNQESEEIYTYITILDVELHALLFCSNYERLSLNCWDVACHEKFSRLRYGYMVKWGIVL